MATKKFGKPLPSWVEMVCVAAFCVTAVLEWNRGETFWAALFAVAALSFSATALYNRLWKS